MENIYIFIFSFENGLYLITPPCFQMLETDIIFGEKLSPNSITGFCKPLASLDILGQQSFRKPRASLDVVC